MASLKHLDTSVLGVDTNNSYELHRVSGEKIVAVNKVWITAEYKKQEKSDKKD
jgi:hypothetical protein